MQAISHNSAGAPVDLSVRCWGNDSKFGMGSERYKISGGNVLRGNGEPFPVSSSDKHYISVALHRLKAIEPQEPYTSLRNRVVEALEIKYPPQP